jgi:hypothetical protein
MIAKAQLVGNGAKAPRDRRVALLSVQRLNYERGNYRKMKEAHSRLRDRGAWLADKPQTIEEKVEDFNLRENDCRYELWMDNRKDALAKLRRALLRALRFSRLPRLLPATKAKSLSDHLHACLDLLPAR